MDDAIGPIAGTILVIMAIIYFIQFIILAALVLPFLFFLGRNFFRQLTQRYRLTLVSGITLVMIGLCSLLLAFILLKAAGDYPGEFASLLAIPIFLCLASATLGLWGMAKLSHLAAAVGKAEKQERISAAKIGKLQRPIDKLISKIQQLEADHGESMAQRRQMEKDLHRLCTGPGDRRFIIMQKEHIENRVLSYTDSELARLSKELRAGTHPGAEDGIELLLIEMALIDRYSNQAHVRLQSHQMDLDRLQEEARYFRQEYQEAELTAEMARQTLAAARAERITLN